MRVSEIPAGFISHDDDSSPYGYPPGVNHATMVSVIIEHDGGRFLFTKQAQCFGWNIAPAAPMFAGLRPVSAPITHYKIEGDE